MTVREPDSDTKALIADRLADEVVSSVITDSMSEWLKIYKLWHWMRNNVKYTSTTGDMTSEYTGAYEGLHDRRGDCYSFYATFKILLDKAGIQNLKCTRVGGTSEHYWNLVMCDGKWYHCDTSPRKLEYPFCVFLQTDAQVLAYADSYRDIPNYYTIDWDAYPERATVPIYDGWTQKSLKTDVKITKSDLLAKIEELRIAYPAGSYWNGKDLSVTDVPCDHNNQIYNCNYYHGPTSLLFDYHNAGEQCLGFLSLLSDLCVGEDTSAYVSYDYKDARIGDQIRIDYKDDSINHNVFIIDKTDDYIVVAECNRDFETCLIEWDRVITREELENKDVFYICRTCEILYK